MVLNFIPPFDMEAHGACGYDYVEVSSQQGSMSDRACWLVLSGRSSDHKNVMYPSNLINEIKKKNY